MELSFVVPPEETGTRLDVFLARHAELSRARVQKLIEAGEITVNGRPERANYRLREGDRLLGHAPPPVEPKAVPQDIPLDVVYEDQDVLVLNKPAGLVVHPAPGHPGGTLVNALLHHCPDLAGIGGVLRPGIVHRLDRDTTGLLAVAKNDLAHRGLVEQLKRREVHRTYLALVHGQVAEPAGVVQAAIGRDPRNRQRMAVVERNGREAVTRYRVLERWADFTLLEVRLETGRTHQIRVHMAYLGHPVVGDPVYGRRQNPWGLRRQLLHAYRLEFAHPRSGKPMRFTAPLPQHFRAVLAGLRGEGGGGPGEGAGVEGAVDPAGPPAGGNGEGPAGLDGRAGPPGGGSGGAALRPAGGAAGPGAGAGAGGSAGPGAGDHRPVAGHPGRLALVRVIPLPRGYDLRVTDPAASVQDYLEALEGAEERLAIPRQHRKEGPCRGCHWCCHERVPLTSVDVLLLQESLRREGRDLAWHQVLQRHAWVEVRGNIVDITLRRLPEGDCHLLDGEAGTCRRHPFRPLVCRTYLCCRLSPAARDLRSYIVNAGEDDLVRRWLLDARERGVEPYVHEAEDPRVDLNDWPPNPFSGREAYAQVRLRELCPEPLWRKLAEEGEKA